jgi:hypothetical protein
MRLRTGWLLAMMLAKGNAHAGEGVDLSWLSGDWCGEREGVQNEEHWSSAKAGVMLGWHRDTRDGKLAGFEFMRISFDAEGVRFHAQPGGKPETVFPATVHEVHRLVFEQPAHDFPKRVHYRLKDNGDLFARIDDGTDTGPSMEWTWSRCVAAAK